MEHPRTPTDGHLLFLMGQGPCPTQPTPEALAKQQEEAAQNDQKVCATCGESVRSNAHFCPYCGTRFPALSVS